MEQKKPMSHITAGLLLAGLLIAFSLIIFLINGNASGPSGGWLSYCVIVVGLMVLINLYGRAKEYYPKFGELFSYGFKTTAMLTLVFVIFLVILLFAMPDLKEKAIEAARNQMETEKKLSDSDIEKGISLVRNYFWVFTIGGTVLAFVIVGAIGSLLGAAVTKKRPDNPFQQLPS